MIWKIFKIMDTYSQMLEEIQNYPSFENAEPNLRRRYGSNMVNEMKARLNINTQPSNKAVAENFMGSAQFSINVTRVSANIPAALPVPIFGTTQLQEKFASSLKGLLPAGVSIVSIALGYASANPNRMLITYTDGSEEDTVIVTCSTIGYGALLSSLQTDTVKVAKIRYTISDVTKLAQYLNPVDFFKKSLFGKSDNDSLTPDTYRVPSQNQTGLLDIDTQFFIDKDFVLIPSIGAYTNFTVGLNMFVADYKKLNASNLIRG